MRLAGEIACGKKPLSNNEKISCKMEYGIFQKCS